MRVETESIAREHGQSIREAFMAAQRRLVSTRADEFGDLRKLTLTLTLLDYIYAALRERLGPGSGFEFIGNRFIGYRSRFLIRVKKLDERLHPCVNDTDAAETFHCQGSLGIYDDPTNLYLGYVSDEVTGEILRIAFVCFDVFGRLDWHVDIEGAEAPMLDFPAAMPTRPRVVARTKNGEDDQSADGTPGATVARTDSGGPGA